MTTFFFQNIKNYMYKKIIYLTITLLLTACGFHMRGYTALPDSLQRVAIEPNNPYLPLQSELSEMLRYSGATVVTAAQQPTSILYIKSERFRTEDTSIGADGRVREKSYIYAIVYELKTPKGATLMGPETLSTERIVEFDPNAVLSQTSEEHIIRNELRTDITNQLMRRLSYAPDTAPTKSTVIEE
jgi:LPS-assembly lipoprotein